MKKSRLLGAVCAVLFTFITVSANATLLGRLPATPGGMDYQAAYDDMLDITWLTDAGLSGAFNWDNRVGWADGLDSANYLGVGGWRLASMSVAAGLPTGTATSIVYCVLASEMDCRDNELGYMFYHNMGGSHFDNKTGNQTVDGVLLTDVQSAYWSGTESPPKFLWFFNFRHGDQTRSTKNFLSLYGWAVRTGDVPLPPALWLFGSGLIGLIGVARRKKA